MEIAEVISASGRYALKVAGIVVAIEADICRDCNIADRTWNRENLEEAARKINEAVKGAK